MLDPVLQILLTCAAPTIFTKLDVTEQQVCLSFIFRAGWNQGATTKRLEAQASAAKLEVGFSRGWGGGRDN